MKKISLKNKYKLPSSVKVSTKKTPAGGFVIELLDYPGSLSYAEDLGELVEVVNDLILTYFQVPRKDAQKADFIYVPALKESASTFTPRFSYA